MDHEIEAQWHQRKLSLDWYNHLTTSGLVILGGIFGFLPSGDPPAYAMVAVFLVIIGAALALGAASQIVEGQLYKGHGFVSKHLRRYAHLFVALGALVFVIGRIKHMS